jgi:GGDEF domain-containing protein
MEEKIKKLVTKDILTGFYNRRKFKEIIRIEIERVKRYNQPLSIIMFDIDHFKKMGLRVIEWVNLYLLEHTSKDFQTEIFLVS